MVADSGSSWQLDFYTHHCGMKKNKEFMIWLREAKAWKEATSAVTGLKEVHGLQLALHLPDGSEIRHQIFDTLDTDEMKGESGWRAVITLIEKHYKKDDNTTAFETWKEFRNLVRKDEQNIEQYIMMYEKYKVRMKRFKMDLGERIHGLNLLCGANLSDSNLRIAMREVDGDSPDEMYEQAKKALKKYFGNSAIKNEQSNKAVDVIVPPTVKQEPLFTSMEEYESFVAWKQYRQRGKPHFPDERNPHFHDDRKPQYQGNRNPTGATGKPLTCRICRSICHFARDCPHKNKPKNSDERSSGNANRTFVAAVDKNIIECQASETSSSGVPINYMILDTGCPQNVAGLVWTQCFLDSMSDRMFKCVEEIESESKFKFGGGRVLKSLYKLKAPVMIAGELTYLTFDVVDTELPLLLGKQTMKSWDVTICTRNDTAEFTLNDVKKNVELFTSPSGHWCVNVQPGFPEEVVDIMFSVQEMTPQEKESAAKRIHRQFCHPPFEFLKKVLNILDNPDKEFIDILKRHSEKCLVCKRYKPTIPRPAVGNLFDPDKMKFNEVVSIDLKQRNGKWIIYLIDMVTRYTRAAFVPSKEKQVIVSKILELWIPIFGAAKAFHMDNGGEFANDEMRELGNQFGINIKHTAAYSPWANGLNERNHATVDVMMEKMLEDTPNMSETMALQYAVSVRNCCMFVHGFTPAQLAIGRNPRLPSAISDEPPALEGSTSSSVIAEHLNAIATARKAFIQAQTSAKLRKALNHPVREYADVKYQTGDNVYYKLPDDRRWQGPATVIGADGKVIMLRHGSVIRRVHPCRLQLVNGTSNDKLSNETVNTSNEDETIIPQDGMSPSTQLSSITQEEEATLTQETVPNQPAEVGPTVQSQVHKSSILPRKNQSVDFRYDDSDWNKVKILGPAGKKGGIHQNWLNVEDENKKQFSMDWEKVSEWKLTKPDNLPRDAETNETYVTCVALTVPDEFLEAKKEELSKWREYEAYHEVADIGQPRLTGRWVCTRKSVNGQVIRKARYVIKGFQEDASIPSDSPTDSKESLRIMLSTVASKQWVINSIDIRSAFF